MIDKILKYRIYIEILLIGIFGILLIYFIYNNVYINNKNNTIKNVQEDHINTNVIYENNKETKDIVTLKKGGYIKYTDYKEQENNTKDEKIVIINDDNIDKGETLTIERDKEIERNELYNELYKKYIEKKLSVKQKIKDKNKYLFIINELNDFLRNDTNKKGLLSLTEEEFIDKINFIINESNAPLKTIK